MHFYIPRGWLVLFINPMCHFAGVNQALAFLCDILTSLIHRSSIYDTLTVETTDNL